MNSSWAPDISGEGARSASYTLCLRYKLLDLSRPHRHKRGRVSGNYHWDLKECFNQNY